MNEPERERWRARMIQHLLPWDRQPIRPAEVIDTLCAIVVDRKNMLEDANYAKYVPNQFVVELGEANYDRNYQPIEDRIIRQWQDRLQEYLMLANNRLGRIEYRLGGRLGIEIRPATGLKEDQARVLYRLDSTAEAQQRELTACVELLADGRRWRMRNGVLSVGRDPTCDIYLDTPPILSKRLVSSRHAYIVCDNQRCRLFDGDPGGGPSLNGSYVNNRIVQPAGHELQDGDMIILAALVLGQPRPDTPGVAVLRFVGNCP